MSSTTPLEASPSTSGADSVVSEESPAVAEAENSAADVRKSPSRLAAWIPCMITGLAVIVLLPLTNRYLALKSDHSEAQGEPPPAPVRSVRPNNPIQPILPITDLDERVVALGRKLFHDRRLSANGKVSCASCHIPSQGGDDNRVSSEGFDGELGDVNAPTILNSAYNFRQFWDGRAASLEEQVDGPLHHPKEMNSNWDHVMQIIYSDEDYKEAFIVAFTGIINRENVRTAIATYERSLVTPGSRFDQWLLGDDNAISKRELRGYELFAEYRCISCHQGVNVGGNMYQRLGVMSNYFTDRREETEADLGRYNVTKDERDKYVFKVPTLRNIEVTAPYFHDGSCKTLEDAVRAMIQYQLGRPVVEDNVELITAFLRTLTAELPSE